MEPKPGPVLRRRQVGARLRRLREAAGKSLDDAAAYLECSAAKISRVETGRLLARIPDVRAMCVLYGVDDAEQERLLRFVRESREPGWWQAYSDVMPDEGRGTFIGLCEAAERICWYGSYLVPGLLQTRGYALALSAPRIDVPDEQVDRLVELKMRSQDLLSRPAPPQLEFVIDEAALRRWPQGANVMRGQLDRLVAAAELSHVSIRVLLFSAGPAAPEGVSFVLFSFADPDQPQIVYYSDLWGNHFIDKLEEVARYRIAFNSVREAALAPAESIAYLRALPNVISNAGGTVP